MGRPKKLTEAQVAEVFAAWNNGKPVKTIAMNHSVSIPTIYKTLNSFKPEQLDLGLEEDNNADRT